MKDATALAEAPPDALLLERPVAYWRDLRTYRPAEAAAQVGVPLLILQGKRDYQVTPADFAGGQAALTGRSAVLLKSYPALGHPYRQLGARARIADRDSPYKKLGHRLGCGGREREGFVG